MKYMVKLTSYSDLHTYVYNTIYNIICSKYLWLNVSTVYIHVGCTNVARGLPS